MGGDVLFFVYYSLFVTGPVTGGTCKWAEEGAFIRGGRCIILCL